MMVLMCLTFHKSMSPVILTVLLSSMESSQRVSMLYSSQVTTILKTVSRFLSTARSFSVLVGQHSPQLTETPVSKSLMVLTQELQVFSSVQVQLNQNSYLSGAQTPPKVMQMRQVSSVTFLVVLEAALIPAARKYQLRG